MAIDNENKRRSVLGYMGVFAVVGPRPDGNIDEQDRKHVAGRYRGQLVAAAVFSLLAPAGVAITFLIGDINGRALTEIRADIPRVSWRKNGVGALAFSLPRTDSKLRPEYFVEGNRVLLQFDNGLPAWGGVLTGARDWSDTAVSFEANSGEWLLATRRTPRNRTFDQVTVGAILTTLLADADAYYPSGLRLGNIWQGGALHSPEYHYKTLYDVVADSLVDNLSAGAFDVTPALEGGYIVFYVNLYERQGSDKPQVVLAEGRNVSALRYRELDEVVNVWHMAGEGDNWGETARVYATAINEESVARHGMREDFEVRSGVVEQTTIDEAARARLLATAWPTRVLGLTVLNESPGRYGQYGIGDAVTCRLYSVGMAGVNGLFEVAGREFFPQDGVSDLVLLEAG